MRSFPRRPLAPIALTAALFALSSHAFQYEKSVPEIFSRALEDDLRQLEKLDFKTTPSPRTLELLQMEEINATSLRSWLDERAKIIVSEEFDPSKTITAQKPARFENDSFPDMDPPTKPPEDQKSNEKPVTVMSNIGAGLFCSGKLRKSVVVLQPEGLSPVEIDSPRAGLIKIGEGLFLPRALINKDSPESIANSLGRLTTFFHEARHSDGNGKSLAFMHTYCPVGHDYQGYAACDRNRNGPYTIGSEIGKLLVEACESCTVAEKEKLRLRTLDHMSRVLETYPTPIPEKQLESMRLFAKACRLLKPSSITEGSECAKILALAAMEKDGKINQATSDFDPTPEKAKAL